jgi:ribosomal protein S18 acetylase RimI-like enzyme
MGWRPDRGLDPGRAVASAAVRARLATHDDVDAICRVCAEGYRDTYPDLLEPEQIEAIVGEYCDPERIRGEIGPRPPAWSGWIVAEDDAGTVVCAGAGGMTAADVGEVFVLYAEPRLQRRGAGSAVLDLLTRGQREAGARTQEVAVTPGNEVALAFYAGHGFAVAGRRRPSQQARAEPSLLLRREL